MAKDRGKLGRTCLGLAAGKERPAVTAGECGIAGFRVRVSRWAVLR